MSTTPRPRTYVYREYDGKWVLEVVEARAKLSFSIAMFIGLVAMLVTLRETHSGLSALAVLAGAVAYKPIRWALTRLFKITPGDEYGISHHPSDDAAESASLPDPLVEARTYLALAQAALDKRGQR